MAHGSYSPPAQTQQDKVLYYYLNTMEFYKVIVKFLAAHLTAALISEYLAI